MLQKVESPSRKAESVPKYEERTSEFDKTLTSGGANPDKVQYQHLHSCIQDLCSPQIICLGKPCQPHMHIPELP